MNKDDGIFRDNYFGRSDESALERNTRFALDGPPELKAGEKRRYLGNFRERILKTLTFEQILEKGTYPEIEEALKDKRARKLVISRKVDLNVARDYIELARQNGLTFATVDSPQFIGDIGLVVVADDAVDVEDIVVESRTERLKKLGIPEELINAVGERLCPRCYQIISEKAPEEKERYKAMSFIDRLIGTKCTGCSERSSV